MTHLLHLGKFHLALKGELLKIIIYKKCCNKSNQIYRMGPLCEQI